MHYGASRARTFRCHWGYKGKKDMFPSYARTSGGLLLKVVCIIDDDGIAYLKSAYGPPSQSVIRLF